MQNVAEAEFVVATYQFMRLRGYPANKISILTTYNGQKALIRDVLEQRCATHPAFGRPRTVCLHDIVISMQLVQAYATLAWACCAGLIAKSLLKVFP